MMQRQKPEVGKSYRTPLLPELRSIDEKARTIEFVASTEKTDRYGDVIRVGGWKLDNYLRNPVFLWGHKSTEPPIGKCVNLKIEAKPPALVQTIQFADASTYPFADTIFQLYKGSYMRAVSVGFMPTEQPKPITDLEGHFTGYEFNGQELLELSAVPIPANADCLARAVQKGFSEADIARAFTDDDEYYYLTPEQMAEWQWIQNEVNLFDRDLKTLTLKMAMGQTADVLRKVLDAFPKRVLAPKKTRDIATIEQFGEAVKPGEKSVEITSLHQLGELLEKVVSQ
jgi:HK97 family phage prohead protease